MIEKLQNIADFIKSDPTDFLQFDLCLLHITLMRPPNKNQFLLHLDEGMDHENHIRFLIELNTSKNTYTINEFSNKTGVVPTTLFNFNKWLESKGLEINMLLDNIFMRII